MRVQPLLVRGRLPHRLPLWLFVGLIAAAGVAVTLDRAVFSGGTRAVSSAPKDVRESVGALVSGSIPGAILFVRQGDRSYTITAGSANERKQVPMRPRDTYPIGSTTKTFTAVLVMRLVAQGKIMLDAPVSRYLPGLFLPGTTEITIRELLNHTSGLHDYEGDPAVLAPYFMGDLGFQWKAEDIVRTERAQPLLFTPGTQFNYTSTDSIVLGLVAEAVDGRSYASQLRDYILRPLGLRDTTLPSGGVPDVHGFFAWSKYDPEESTAPIDGALLTPTIAWAAGGIRSTVADVAAFWRGLFSGDLLPRAQVAAMEDTAATGGQYGLALIPTGGRAYVWGNYTRTINTRCGRAWGHGGNFPGYFNAPISSPDGSRQAVLLVNADPSQMTQAQITQFFDVLSAAYCRGVTS